MPEPFLAVVPNGLARHLDPYPLQASNEKGLIRVRTLPYDCVEISTPRSYKYHQLWKCLTSHYGDYYLTRAYPTLPPKGTKLGYRAYAMKMHVSVCGETTDSYSQAKQ